jgi:hypothetical protein
MNPSLEVETGSDASQASRTRRRGRERRPSLSVIGFDEAIADLTSATGVAQERRGWPSVIDFDEAVADVRGPVSDDRLVHSL